jgi:hypothetical protein
MLNIGTYYWYILSIYLVYSSVYWVHTQYILSTGLCQLRSDVAVLLLGLLPSTNSVHTWYGTVLYWWVLCYSTIPPCTALYWYIPPCNVVHYSGEIDILIWYSVHLNLYSPNGCADMDALSTKWKCRLLLNCEQHYKEVCTTLYSYATSVHSMVISMVNTWYIAPETYTSIARYLLAGVRRSSPAAPPGSCHDVTGPDINLNFQDTHFGSARDSDWPWKLKLVVKHSLPVESKLGQTVNPAVAELPWVTMSRPG